MRKKKKASMDEENSTGKKRTPTAPNKQNRNRGDARVDDRISSSMIWVIFVGLAECYLNDRTTLRK